MTQLLYESYRYRKLFEMALKDSTRSARLTKYRETLQKEGFSRFELFISQEIRDIVQGIAKEQNIGAAQAASLLLEYAAKQYVSNRENSPFHESSLQENPPTAPQFCFEPWDLSIQASSVQSRSIAGASGSATGLSAKEPSLYSQAVNPATLGLIRSSREQQLGKSLELAKPNAVALGYLSVDKAAETGNPLEKFFSQRKKD